MSKQTKNAAALRAFIEKIRYRKAGGVDPHAGPVSKDPKLEKGPLRFAVIAYATGFGTGFSPFASGTVGTLVGCLIFWFMAPPYGTWLSYSIGTAILTVLGILSASAVEGIYQKKDDGRVVIDEVAGYLVTMLFVWNPAWTVSTRFQAMVLGFVLFRIFDIWKPWPANYLQSLPGGWGIMIDDVIAGIYGCLILNLMIWIC